MGAKQCLAIPAVLCLLHHQQTVAGAATGTGTGAAVAVRVGVGASISAVASASALPVTKPEEFVNVLAGTAGGQAAGTHHSSGNTLPLVARPWGFNHWAPQTTNERTSWWFNADADTFRGIRCTHQPSPWISDYGWFLLRPVMGSGQHEWLGYTNYRAEGALRPHHMDLTVGPHGVRVELAPTEHAALLRVTFPPSLAPTQRRVCAWVPHGLDKDEDEKRARASGKPSGSCRPEAGGINLESRRFASGVPQGADFALYARIEVVDTSANLNGNAEGSGEGDGSTAGSSVRVVADENKECLERDVQYEPLNMPGQDRTPAADAEQCQKRCADMAGCAHFAFWPDGGCHVQDSNAKPKPMRGVVAGPPQCPKEAVSRHCCFEPGELNRLELRIGTSFISEQQAARALKQEVGGSSLEDVAEAGKNVWRELLTRIEVLDAGPPVAATWRRLQIFYSCLYRVLLFPRRLDENTVDGVRHWSPYDGQVRVGRGVTDNGFWDTFRTVYPLLTLAYPQELGELLDGWLSAYLAGGWLPKWASPGYRDSMVGTFGDVVLADAILKNISGFSLDVAWQALKKDAFEVSGPKDTSRGKFGLSHYEDKGYIPVDVGIGESCSRTLDFAFADAATAAAATRLGHKAEAERLRTRSRRALSEIYDASSGLMGHRLASGAFKPEPFETWGDCFTEGSAWHHSFPPFDVAKLAELHGGPEHLLSRLWELLTVPSTFQVGSYKTEIHEMREMRMLGLGQYAHNNQPTHHLPYLFAMLGDRNATAWLVRRILATAYSPEGFSGDEDNGEMGAWFVLSAMGLYAPAVGVSEDYVLGAVPLFPRLLLRDLDVSIEAPAAAEDAPALGTVFWRTGPWTAASLPYSELRRGGALRFESAGGAPLGRLASALRGAWRGALRRARTVSAVAPAHAPAAGSPGRPRAELGARADARASVGARTRTGGGSGEGWLLAGLLVFALWGLLAVLRRACRAGAGGATSDKAQ